MLNISVIIVKIKSLPKKYILIGMIAIISISVGIFTILKLKQGLGYDFIEARKGTLSQEVSVSGKLKPSQSLDLGFEIGGVLILFGVALPNLIFKKRLN
ncbi:MAG: hypothetical protein COX42_00465 [Parcubacteria group bacterium CG23_combo_of_CG06-09_8_20_14_all_35_6]|nr:MAG: hypothetical protein COX42_00465 [Parcubacteria group bacterium CG23_combo_of_CG06-09_8_20_14_all_35_6]